MKEHRRASDGCTRNKLRSPGRPPVWQRENPCRFWQAVAAGRTSEEAAVDAGVSPPVGVRWFRSSGGMPPTHLALSAKPTVGHYLTFAEREDIAIEVAKGTEFELLRASSNDRRARFRANCGATPLRVAAISTIAPAPRNGMPTGQHGGQSRASWRQIRRCVTMYRSAAITVKSGSADLFGSLYRTGHFPDLPGDSLCRFD